MLQRNPSWKRRRKSPDDLSPKTYLIKDSSGDEPASTILTRKRQCRSLISFVGHVLKQLPSTKLEGREQEDLRSILATLVEFSTVRDEKQASGGNELSETSRWSLLNALGTIRVDEFASAILSMVQGVDKRVSYTNLFSRRADFSFSFKWDRCFYFPKGSQRSLHPPEGGFRTRQRRFWNASNGFYCRQMIRLFKNRLWMRFGL